MANFVYHKDEENGSKKSTVVMGVGNLLLKDEGVGIHVVQALQDSPLLTNVPVKVIDGGTSPDVVHLLDGTDKLIVIDAVKGGGHPGSIYRFQANDVPMEANISTSLHQIGLLDTLNMMECIGSKPKDVVIIGVETKEIDWGLELSPELEQKIPQIIRVVLQELGRG